MRTTRCPVTARAATALILLLAMPSLPAPAVAATAVTGCDARCLVALMDRYLDGMIRNEPARVPLAPAAILRENTATVKPGEGVWRTARAVRARQDFPDPVSGQVWSFLGVELDGGAIAQMSVRLRSAPGRRIAEAELVINTGSGDGPYPGGPFLKENVLEPDVLFTAPVPRARQSTREELIRLANGYFEALGTSDAGAAKFGLRCQRFESGAGGGINLGGRRGGGIPGVGGAAANPAAAAAVAIQPESNLAPNGYSGGASMCGGSMGGARQTTIERRFPVAIPELGIVVGYMFIMHHERTPPQDNFINEIFKVVDGKIRQIDAVGFQMPAPARSGYVADFPDPGVIRSMSQEMTRAMYPPAVVPAASAGAPARAPQRVNGMPQAPYAGISVARDLAYGPDPQQRLDILYPAATTATPRAVVIFVHGGGWAGGDKHAAGDDLYENVAWWAARAGMIGVNINYRLADYANGRNLYPVGEQDVAAAVDWIGAHVQHYGGDPQRMFLWGHSAGGSHVASYASNPAIHGLTPLVKGIFILSAPLDLTLDEDSGRPVAYYGKTHEEFVERSPLRTLAASRVPVLLGYSSDETGLVPQHAERARQQLCAAGRCPRLVLTRGSHQGEMLAVGTDDRSSTDALLELIGSQR